MDPRPSTEFSSKMHKSLRSLAEYLVDLTYLCCHYMFESYITCLTLSFNTVHVPSFTLIFLLWSWKVIISAARCSLEPRLFPMKLCPLKALLGFQNTPRPPSFVDTCYTHFSADYSTENKLYLYQSIDRYCPDPGGQANFYGSHKIAVLIWFDGLIKGLPALDV